MNERCETGREPEIIERLRAYGSDGSFEGDLKLVLGMHIISNELETIGDINKMKDRIVEVHEWHMRQQQGEG